MRKLFAFVLLAALNSSFLIASSDPSSNDKSYEISFLEAGKTPNHTIQARLRQQSFWKNFIAENGTWYVHFDESTALPVRAYGKPIAVPGGSPEEKALNFILSKLDNFNLPVDEFVFNAVSQSKKYSFVSFKQIHDGLEVLGSRMLVKISNTGEVVLFGSEVYSDIEMASESYLSINSAAAFASSNLPFPVENIESNESLYILPIPTENGMAFRPVYKITVSGLDGVIPVKLMTFVDAADGTLWYRSNEVKHSGEHCHHPGHEHEDEEPPAASSNVLAISGTVLGEVNPFNPYESTQTLPIPHLGLNISGTTYYTDQLGFFSANATGPLTSNFNLSGRWCRIYTNGVTPTFSVGLAEGSGNDVSIDQGSNIKERSTYWSTNQIHDYMKELLPDFDGMDFQLTTNVDVVGDCNAFYDGSSINFYIFGNGCNATSLISDVVYHEYGHGINDQYYQSQGAFFMNGGMNEGYADFWALSLMESPLLGVGFYLDNEDPLRRYDTDLKVYPLDLVGQVHADGQIICGAWHTTHLLMGGDWDLTRDLFVEAYPGLQATAMNGNEGVAFTNVLIDALQADDDDNDITNGTPNGDAIVEGFATHGITLISNAELNHTPLEFAEQAEEIEVDVELVLNFPFNQYLDSAFLFWKTSGDEWTETAMTVLGGDNFNAFIPAQPAGTIIAYHVGAKDINNIVANVLPIGAREADPNIPFFILVGYDLQLVHDNDTNEQFGNWDIGLSDDNATTGEWEQEFPVGSFSTPGDLSTAVAPYFQHTPGIDGELCLLTGVSSSPDAPVGENDVDGGKTTLQTPEIDLTTYNNPAFTYWRWYTNSPPTGANPGADYWEVKISDDGGDSWTHVEATKTSDASWRRFAFKVSDYVDLTDQVMLQFIASDSIRPGQYLDGGSLVEAALDDFHLYDAAQGNSIGENSLSDRFSIWPNPAVDQVFIDWTLSNSSKVSVEIVNLAGQIIFRKDLGQRAPGTHRYPVDVSELAEGVYLLKLKSNGEEQIQRLFRSKQ